MSLAYIPAPHYPKLFTPADHRPQLRIVAAPTPEPIPADHADRVAYGLGRDDGLAGYRPDPCGRGLHYSRGYQHGRQIKAARRGEFLGKNGDPFELPAGVEPEYLPECHEGYLRGLADLQRHLDSLAEEADPGREELAPYRSHRDRLVAAGLF